LVLVELGILLQGFYIYQSADDAGIKSSLVRESFNVFGRMRIDVLQ
jgi:hypothetical protein